MTDIKSSDIAYAQEARFSDIENLTDLLRRQAETDPDRLAYSFLADDDQQLSLTVRQLDARARSIAAQIQQQAKSGDRALLVYPPGLEFLSAFFGCMYAGVLPVPATYPKPRRPMPRLLAIAEDCEPTLALTSSQTIETLELPRAAPELQSLSWLPTNEIPEELANQWEPVEARSDDVAFLQYTSGSTRDPKGVMVTHGNLLSNLEMIYKGFDVPNLHAADDERVGVFWLPAYHDMGLVGGVLASLYTLRHAVLMPPTSFLQRPIRWLKAMSDFRASVSGAPNFAFKLCVNKTTPEERAELDLSSWKLAFCGAEPISVETLEQFAEMFEPCGFRADAFYPCYGLAEATLIASGGIGPAALNVKSVLRTGLAEHRVESANGHDTKDVLRLVGCGQALEGEIAIVDPNTKLLLPQNRVGEIWVKGPGVTAGYWKQHDEDKRAFNVELKDNNVTGYLRTGDLGFVGDGQLYVTGRVKDVIIIRGSNHYPQDIEHTVGHAHPALETGSGAAFSVDKDGQERLVAVHELDRQHRDSDLSGVFRRVRSAVASDHDLDMHAVVLIRQASLPRTTSGKVQRNLCREWFLSGQLRVIDQWVRGENGNGSNGNGKHSNGNGKHYGDSNGSGANGSATPGLKRSPKKKPSLGFSPEDVPLSEDQVARLAELIETWMIEWLVERADVNEGEIERDMPFAETGIDSLTAVELSKELEDWLEVKLTPVVAWNYPTPETLALYLAQEAGGLNVKTEEEIDAEEQASENDFERMLAEIESLSDAEIQAALRDPQE